MSPPYVVPPPARRRGGGSGVVSITFLRTHNPSFLFEAGLVPLQQSTAECGPGRRARRSDVRARLAGVSLACVRYGATGCCASEVKKTGGEGFLV